MEVSIHGKQINVGDALRTHVRHKLEDINAKYFNRAIDTVVTFSPESHAFIKAHITLKIGKDIMVSGSAEDTDAYAAFDHAATKVAKQMRRYKTRLRDHHERVDETPAADLLRAQDRVIAAQTISSEDDSDIPLGNDPVIVAETAMNIQKLSVSEAVMRLDLSGQSALLFRNPKTHALNMVYRRSDGNIGWVEPQDEASAKVAAE
jgi:ribosomal subunit interface protein